MPKPRRTDVWVGAQFGALTVIEILHIDKYGSRHLLCQCECGNTIQRGLYGMLRSKNRLSSCGCKQKEIAGRICAEYNKTHGLSKSPEYNIWIKLRCRCNNPSDASFHYYGGRGIQVCERWNKFENFYADMGPRPSSKHSIDRINNDGNYCPENCRWATIQQQRANRRFCRFIEFNGKQMTIADAERAAGCKPGRARQRLNNGFTVEEAFSEKRLPKRKHHAASSSETTASISPISIP